MTKHKIDVIDEFLLFLDRSIARHELIPFDESYLKELTSLVEGVTVDLDQPLPDEDIRKH